MHDVKDDKVQDGRTGLELILVEDGFDAAQCREEVSHKESREAKQRSKALCAMAQWILDWQDAATIFHKIANEQKKIYELELIIK